VAELRLLEDQAFKALLSRERAYEREVQAALKAALDRMRTTMAVIYEKYAADGVLTLAEMTRYNRLVTLERQLVAILNPALAANLRTIERLRPSQYDAAFFRYGWAVDNASGLRLAWGVLNPDVILENLASQFYKISIRRYGADARMRIRTALNDGLAQGKSFQDMARGLKKAMDTTYANAIRIIRTEGQTAANAGQEDAYLWAQRKGIDLRMKWDASLDGRTRPDHGAADGQTRGDDGLFRVGGETAPYPGWEGLTAGQRINCRCRIRAEIDGYEPALRRTREQGIIPYQTYAQWIASR
jgi:SPP1 gp7 family putative phage head morphogenesis protein